MILSQKQHNTRQEARPMWRFAILAVILLFSLPNHANSARLSRPVKFSGHKSLPTAKLSTSNEFLVAHNKIRAIYNLTPLAWDQKLVRYARRWAATRLNDCKTLVHSPNSPYGENLFWALRDHWSASKVVQYWGDEMQYYDPKTNECINNSVCGHYTQIVWNTTERLGCAHVLCNNNQGYLFVCSYDPPGNIYYQGPFGGRFAKSIVYPQSSSSSKKLSGSQSGTTEPPGITITNEGIVSGATGHPDDKSYRQSLI